MVDAGYIPSSGTASFWCTDAVLPFTIEAKVLGSYPSEHQQFFLIEYSIVLFKKEWMFELRMQELFQSATEQLF